MTSHALRAHAPTAEINVTPLIDVMLALVLIFMLTAPLAVHRLSVPLGDSSARSMQATTLILAIKAGGELWLDGTSVNRSALAATLSGAVAEQPAVVLEVHSDADVQYGDVATVLALAKRSGVDAIRVEGVRAR